MKIMPVMTNNVKSYASTIDKGLAYENLFKDPLSLSMMHREHFRILWSTNNLVLKILSY